MELSMREAYGDALVELGREHGEVVALDADLAHATCSEKFQAAFPERFFNVGIAEQNMCCMAAGMANSDLVPFASTFAMFGAGRAYEQIRNGICYSKSNVKIVVSHAGITACGDGGTHQCVEDIALMRVLPNMTLLCPCDYPQAKRLVKEGYKIDGPVYIRISRPPVPVITDENTPFEIGKAQVLRDGTDVCIIATGITVHMALTAAQSLSEQGISSAVINIHTIKPFDNETIIEYARKCGRIVTIEEHSTIGGLGSAVSDSIVGEVSVKMTKLGVDDRFGQSGLMHELLNEYGLTSTNIEAACKQLIL